MISIPLIRANSHATMMIVKSIFHQGAFIKPPRYLFTNQLEITAVLMIPPSNSNAPYRNATAPATGRPITVIASIMIASGVRQ